MSLFQRKLIDFGLFDLPLLNWRVLTYENDVASIPLLLDDVTRLNIKLEVDFFHNHVIWVFQVLLIKQKNADFILWPRYDEVVPRVDSSDVVFEMASQCTALIRKVLFGQITFLTEFLLVHWEPILLETFNEGHLPWLQQEAPHEILTGLLLEILVCLLHEAELFFIQEFKYF